MGGSTREPAFGGTCVSWPADLCDGGSTREPVFDRAHAGAEVEPQGTEAVIHREALGAIVDENLPSHRTDFELIICPISSTHRALVLPFVHQGVDTPPAKAMLAWLHDVWIYCLFQTNGALELGALEPPDTCGYFVRSAVSSLAAVES